MDHATFQSCFRVKHPCAAWSKVARPLRQEEPRSPRAFITTAWLASARENNCDRGQSTAGVCWLASCSTEASEGHRNPSRLQGCGQPRSKEQLHPPPGAAHPGSHLALVSREQHLHAQREAFRKLQERDGWAWLVAALPWVPDGLGAESQVRSVLRHPPQRLRGDSLPWDKEAELRGPRATEVITAAQTGLMKPKTPASKSLSHLSSACLTGISDSKCPRRSSCPSPPPATICPSRDLPQPGNNLSTLPGCSLGHL